jgi:hypothetical protein
VQAAWQPDAMNSGPKEARGGQYSFKGLGAATANCGAPRRIGELPGEESQDGIWRKLEVEFRGSRGPGADFIRNVVRGKGASAAPTLQYREPIEAENSGQWWKEDRGTC